jgi:hypothetical protein
VIVSHAAGIVEQRQCNDLVQGLRSGQCLLDLGVPRPVGDPPGSHSLLAGGFQRAAAEAGDDDGRGKPVVVDEHDHLMVGCDLGEQLGEAVDLRAKVTG